MHIYQPACTDRELKCSTPLCVVRLRNQSQYFDLVSCFGGGGFTVYLIIPFVCFNYSYDHLECKMSLAYVNVCTGIYYKFAGPNYIKLVKRLEKSMFSQGIKI